ncbi:MAG: hypothetical protein J7642_03525 [Cyanobacteria bacterium SBC]|nr:hypothetical protein [Cyanobacteria bacterium SBC]
MIEIEEQNYPIVSVKFEGVATLEETEAYLSQFTDWLSREKPFGLILYRSNSEDGEDVDRAKQSHELVVRWAKQYKPQIAQYCMGMAVVSDLSQMSERQQQMAPKALGVLFGCPGQVFDNSTDAEQWLQQQLNQLN